MIKAGFFILLFCKGYMASAQNDTVQFVLQTPAYTSEAYYLAGNCNAWNPQNNKYVFTKENDTWSYTGVFTKGTVLEFKITMGGWDKVECAADGKDIANRIIKTDTIKTVYCYVAAWKNNFTKQVVKKTAADNVKIIDTAFAIPQLQRTRRIWLYLPPGYEQSTARYPVLYMHDGQNLFDVSTTAYGEEWGVDETLNALIAKGKAPCIVVGIDNGGITRMSEYNPYKFTWKDSTNNITFASEGNEYISFLINTLKPYIDSRYRTLTGKEHTIVAGSSMGGLISYYAALKYPAVFGKVGIFSPAFWTSPSIALYTDTSAAKNNAKYFFYAGAKEGAAYVTDMNNIMEKLGANSSAMVYSVIDEEGEHNERYWRKWFAEFYSWISADGYNYVIPLQD
jgi:predicted alpha/beta superfamily hydrolase